MRQCPNCSRSSPASTSARAPAGTTAGCGTPTSTSTRSRRRPDGERETMLEVADQPSRPRLAARRPPARRVDDDSRCCASTADGWLDCTPTCPSIATGHCNDMVVDGRGQRLRRQLRLRPRRRRAESPAAAAIVAACDPTARVEVGGRRPAFPNGTVITPDGAHADRRRDARRSATRRSTIERRRHARRTGGCGPSSPGTRARRLHASTPRARIWFADAAAPTSLRVGRGRRDHRPVSTPVQARSPARSAATTGARCSSSPPTAPTSTEVAAAAGRA